jgi:DNA-binding HxlR family transcriptional regulator
MAALSGVDKLDFNELKAELGLTDGNLSTHLGALQRAGFVRITKSFRGKKPRTSLDMTAKGRKAMERYVNLLQSLLRAPKGLRGQMP